MDPNMDLPPVTALSDDRFTDPSPPVNTNHAHPPYAEMISAAISALKDKDGSSRQAISKYIEKEFRNLPPTHSTLLTFNLKRLKNLGQLVMIKHSYMLPSRSGEFQPPESTVYHPTLDFGATDANVASVSVNLENPPSGSSKRRPGRPPKLKPVTALGVHNQKPDVQAYNADIPSYEPQFQYQTGSGEDLGANYGSGSDFQGGSEPLFASLGLGDDRVAVPQHPPSENTSVVVKRGRGRPPKSAGASGGHAVGSGGSEIQVQVGGPGSVSDGGGGGEGVEAVKANGVRVKRGRGRPRRIGFGAVTVPLSGNYLRPRGRPKRVMRPNTAAVSGGGAGETALGKRRRGRPSRSMIAELIGKQLASKGRPGTAVLVTDPQQLVVYQELKTKYEHLQSKVKQVASMVKPCIDPEYGRTALGALQELEDLATEPNLGPEQGNV